MYDNFYLSNEYSQACHVSLKNDSMLQHGMQTSRFSNKKSPQVAMRLIRTDHRLRLNTINESLLSFTLSPYKNPVCYSGYWLPLPSYTQKKKK